MKMLLPGFVLVVLLSSCEFPGMDRVLDASNKLAEASAATQSLLLELKAAGVPISPKLEAAIEKMTNTSVDLATAAKEVSEDRSVTGVPIVGSITLDEILLMLGGLGFLNYRRNKTRAVALKNNGKSGPTE